MIEKIILGIFQLTDNDVETHSIYAVIHEARQFDGLVQFLESEWEECVRTLEQDPGAMDVRGRLDQVESRLDWFRNLSRTRSAMVAFRNEWIAHLVDESRERKRVVELGGSPMDLTYARVMRAGCFVSQLAHELQNILALAVDGGFDQMYRQESELFWRTVAGASTGPIEFGLLARAAAD